MPETDFPCCENKPAPEWYSDRVQQAINRYNSERALEEGALRVASRHQSRIAEDLRAIAAEHRQRAHDAVLEAAEAVKQERAS